MLGHGLIRPVFNLKNDAAFIQRQYGMPGSGIHLQDFTPGRSGQGVNYGARVSEENVRPARFAAAGH